MKSAARCAWLAASGIAVRRGDFVRADAERRRYTRVTPAKGDCASVPFSIDDHRLADTWDLAEDEREGSARRRYGAAAIIGVSGASIT